ncbi:MAG: hypothetical protein LBP87_02050 [Planctomycetaceae bacterium]|jgi:hypothetical protein|nr:hypothetical protein [Planctomycetaceae bacterium]
MSISFQLLLFAQSNWLTTIADWCGIAGLAVSLIGLFLTLLTFWKVQSVKETIETERQKRILQNRLSEYHNQFVDARNFILAVYDLNVDNTNIGRVSAEIIIQLVAIIKCCKQIKKYDQLQRLEWSDIEELKKETEIVSSHFSERSPNLKIPKDELWKLLPKLETIIRNIEDFQKNQIAEFSYGFRKNFTSVVNTQGNDVTKKNQMES